MKRVFLFVLALATLSATFAKSHQPNSLKTLCQDPEFQTKLVAPRQFAPVPKWSDDFWRTQIPEDMRKDLIKAGEKKLKSKWESIDPVLFSQFRKDGNRTNYESVYFNKRSQLMTLAVAELMEGEGRFIPNIIKGIHSLLEETYWGLPAHYGPELPQPDIQTLDLFSAETGSLLAWIGYLFAEPIEEFSPLLTQRMQQEIQRRIIDEANEHVEWWRSQAMNWNTWICSNWLPCILFVEPDRDKQINAVKEVAKSLDIFLDNYPEDGGCDEGPSYWDRAAGSLFDCLVLLKQATDGYIDISNDDKLAPMAEYFCKMSIDGTHFVNFADASATIDIYPDWYPSADYLQNAPLMGMIAEGAAKRGFYSQPSQVSMRDHDYSIDRQVQLFALLGKSADGKLAAAATGNYELPLDVWLPNTEVMAARSKQNSIQGLYFAAKGGHNNEYHNHNDIGQFIVYADGNPLLIDVGRATYTKDTFNSNRYKNWNVQSAYHNVPRINGVDQMQGAEYKSKDINMKANKKEANFTLDIAGAYPSEAQVDSWIRNIKLSRGKDINVTEDYQLRSYVAPTELVFISPLQPELEAGALIFTADDGKKYQLIYNPSQVVANVEPLSYDDAQIKKRWTSLYRITLTTTSNNTKGKINYTIKSLQ